MKRRKEIHVYWRRMRFDREEMDREVLCCVRQIKKDVKCIPIKYIAKSTQRNEEREEYSKIEKGRTVRGCGKYGKD